jgi:hypothetical protein
MALIAFDSCTRYSAAYDVGTAYTKVGTITGTTAGVQLHPYAAFYNRSVFTGFDTALVGMRVTAPNGNAPSTRTQMAILKVLSGTTVLGRLDVGTDGSLLWYAHATSTALSYLVGISDTIVPRGLVQDVQVYVRLADTAVGWVEVRLNGIEILNVPDVITATAAAADGIAFCYSEGNGLGVTGTPLLLGGYFIYTANGATLTFRNTSWKIDRLVPVGAGAKTQWTPNLVDYVNWQCVDDTGFSADNDYVSANSLIVGATDLYDYTTCTPNSTVGAVRIAGLATTETDDHGYKLQARVGGSDYLSAEFDTFTDYTYRQDTHQWLVNPNTSAAWTAAGINGAEFGAQLTT